MIAERFVLRRVLEVQEHRDRREVIQTVFDDLGGVLEGQEVQTAVIYGVVGDLTLHQIVKGKVGQVFVAEDDDLVLFGVLVQVFIFFGFIQ